MIKIYSILKHHYDLPGHIVLLTAVIPVMQETRQLTVNKPQAIADLKTVEGAALVNAKWFVQEAHIRDIDLKQLPVPMGMHCRYIQPAQQ